VIKSIYLLLAFTFVWGATPGHSSVIFSLDHDSCTGTCGTGPFGQVSLDQTTASLVTVTVTLKPGEVFGGTGAGEALEFNIAGPVTIGGFSAGFGLGPSLDKVASFGTFLQSVSCTACTGGQSTNPSGPLTFTVTSSSGVVISDFGANAKGYYFSVNLIGTNGNGGNVAATEPLDGGAVSGTNVPEPVSASLIGIGLVALGLSRRLSRRHV
jgi:hypothetical protein